MNGTGKEDRQMPHNIQNIPDQPTNPPEPTEAQIAKNQTLDLITDIVDGLWTASTRIYELQGDMPGYKASLQADKKLIDKMIEDYQKLAAEVEDE